MRTKYWLKEYNKLGSMEHVALTHLFRLIRDKYSKYPVLLTLEAALYSNPYLRLRLCDESFQNDANVDMDVVNEQIMVIIIDHVTEKTNRYFYPLSDPECFNSALQLVDREFIQRYYKNDYTRKDCETIVEIGNNNNFMSYL